MAKIRPITDMRNTTELSELCHESQEPVYITKNGKEDMVVMSHEAYEREQALMGMYRKLGEAEKQLIDGVEPLEAGDVFSRLQEKYGYR